MRITDIHIQKRNTTRRSVFLDGVFAFGVCEMTSVKYTLYIGKEIDERTIVAIKQDEAANDVKNVALRYRSYRPRTRKEVIDHLQKKEYADEEIELALQFLVANKLLDDTEFARMYCRDAVQRKPLGTRALQQKLLARGIDRHIIDTVITEQITPEGENDAARAIAEKLFSRYSTSRKQLDADTIKKRLYDNLARRGFSYSIIQSAVQTVCP